MSSIPPGNPSASRAGIVRACPTTTSRSSSHRTSCSSGSSSRSFPQCRTAISPWPRNVAETSSTSPVRAARSGRSAYVKTRTAATLRPLGADARRRRPRLASNDLAHSQAQPRRAAVIVKVPEAELKKTDEGLIPQAEGWFVLNAREASWIRSEERGQDTDFQGGQEWAGLGFRIQVVAPGQRGMYHAERGQEDFLVVSGECVLVIEGQERRLEAWDFVHCPPWTQHVFVGAGDAPCAIVMAGSRARVFEVLYPVNEVAAKHDASVLEDTSRPDEAYARWGPETRSAYGEGWLPS